MMGQEADTMETDARREAEAAVEHARRGPPPDEAELLRHVDAEPGA
jgi:hypothetical protein